MSVVQSFKPKRKSRRGSVLTKTQLLVAENKYLHQWDLGQKERREFLKSLEEPLRYWNFEEERWEDEKGPLVVSSFKFNPVNKSPVQADNFNWVMSHLTGQYLYKLDGYTEFMKTLPIKYMNRPQWRSIHKMCLKAFVKPYTIPPFDAFLLIPAFFGHPCKYIEPIFYQHYCLLNRGRSKKLSVVNILYASCRVLKWDHTWIPCKLNQKDKDKYEKMLRDALEIEVQQSKVTSTTSNTTTSSSITGTLKDTTRS